VESAEKEEREGEGGVDEGGVVAAAPQHWPGPNTSSLFINYVLYNRQIRCLKELFKSIASKLPGEGAQISRRR
jgi:hypothetical protein